MTLTIGRVTISESPTVAAHTGDVFDLVFSVGRATTGGSAVVGKVRRQQLLGLASNPDEPVVPVTSSDDPDLDGYYRVLDVQCEPFAAFLGNGAMRASVTLERISNGYAMPVLERVTTAAVRTNAVGVIDTEPDAVKAWVSSTLPAYGFNSDVEFTTAINRSIDKGDGSTWAITVFLDKAAWALTTHKVFITPSNFYIGGCLIERQVSASWYPVIGRQAPAGMAGAWRISNGLVRFTASATNTGDLKIECWDPSGSGWVAMSTELRYGYDSAGTFTTTNYRGGFARGTDRTSTHYWVEPHIIRNDRDCVVLGFRRAYDQYQTFTLQAGDVFCEFFSRMSDAGLTHAIQSRSSWAGTTLAASAPFSVKSGIQSTSNDANGNRLLLLYTQDSTWTQYGGANTGIVQGTASQDATFGIGVVLDGGSATTGNTGLEVAEQYVTARSVRTFPVAQ